MALLWGAQRNRRPQSLCKDRLVVACSFAIQRGTCDFTQPFITYSPLLWKLASLPLTQIFTINYIWMWLCIYAGHLTNCLITVDYMDGTQYMFVCENQGGIKKVESTIISMAVCLTSSRTKRPFSCQNKGFGSEVWVSAALWVGLLVRFVLRIDFNVSSYIQLKGHWGPLSLMRKKNPSTLPKMQS